MSSNPNNPPQVLFTRITGFVRGELPLEAVKDFFNSFRSEEALLTPSNNSRNAMHHALYVPFNPGRPDSEARSLALLEYFFDEIVPTFSIEQQRQLLQNTGDGNSLLYDALNTKNAAVVRFVFGKVREHMPELYPWVLNLQSRHRDSVISTAAVSGNADLYKFVRDEVDRELGENGASQRFSVNRYGFRVLNEAISAGNVDMVKEVFEDVKRQSLPRYRQLLVLPTHGRSLLDRVLQGGNGQMVRYVYEEVKAAASENYAAMLAQQNKLSTVIGRWNHDVASYVFGEMRSHANAAYRVQLAASNADGYNLYHQAALTEDISAVQFVNDRLYEEFKEEGVALGTRLANQRTASHFEPLARRNQAINDYLNGDDRVPLRLVGWPRR